MLIHNIQSAAPAAILPPLSVVPDVAPSHLLPTVRTLNRGRTPGEVPDEVRLFLYLLTDILVVRGNEVFPHLIVAEVDSIAQAPH